MLNCFIWHIRKLCREVSVGRVRHENTGDEPITKVQTSSKNPNSRLQLFYIRVCNSGSLMMEQLFLLTGSLVVWKCHLSE